jgi:hypothetical protein
MTKVKVFEKKVKDQWVKVMVSNERSCQRNTHVKYESSTPYQSKVKTMVKDFEESPTPRSKIRRSRS